MSDELPRRKSTPKTSLVRCATITGLLLAVIIGFGVWISLREGDLELSAYHPFKSSEAKATYLALYDIKAKKWPVASECRMVDTSYGQTFVRISGRSGAPPLVLLHGAGGNSLQWIPNIKALSESFRTYAVDNICDNGRSIYTRAFESPNDFVNWLNELFNGLELGDSINLMGLSYGGWLAAQYALHFSNRLRKIVLLAPACTVLPLSYKWILRAVLCTIPHRYFTRSFLYWLLADLAQKGDSGTMFIEEHADESYLALRSFRTRRMVNPTVLSDSELQNIKVPTLFLVGENEKIYSAQKAVQRLKVVAPQVETAVIPNAGHDLTIVQAEMVNRKILDFLERP